MGESVVVEVVSASVAGAFSASALYPLEVLKTKMQAESKATSNSTTSTSTSTTNSNNKSESESESDASLEVIENTKSDPQEEDVTTTTSVKPNAKPKTMIKYAQDMYAKDGITPFYAGIGTSAFQSSVEKALYFFAYTALKNIHGFFSTNHNHSMGTTMNLFLGCLAEWAHLPITLPIDCLTTQIQTGDNGNQGHTITLPR